MKYTDDEQAKTYSQAKSYSNVGFKKGKQKCLVCGRMEAWKCRVREDEALGLCSFEPNDDGRTDREGRYIHKIDTGITYSDYQDSVKTQGNSEVSEDKPIEAEYLNDVYHHLLAGLDLDDKHMENLLKRGLSVEEIEANNYKTVTKYYNRYSQLADLVTDFNLEGVPGFYLDEEGWCINMAFPGFYIPYRDINGNIVGLQIRRDAKWEGKRYVWLSSPDKEKGASSGSPLHFVNPDNVQETNEVYLTEGALKADIIGAKKGIGLIATAGVSVVTPKKVSQAIYDSFPDIERIVVAYDIDWQTNPIVKSALIRLLKELRDSVVEVFVAVWDESLGKGLDDVLINENYKEEDVQYIPVDDFLKAEGGVGGDEPPFPPVEVETDDEANPDFVYRWDEFSRLSFPNTDKVIFGLARGNVGLVVASTNVGKTTYSLNLALSATAQREFLPLLNEHHSVKKVLYVDGEATKAELQSDIDKMLESFEEKERESVSNNLFLICDEELNGEPLDLVNPEHLTKIENAALRCNADLIIVDTLSALMALDDENDNAKVKKEVM